MKKIFILLILFFISGCVETVIVGSLATSGMIMSKNNVFNTSQDDKIKNTILKKIKKNSQCQHLKNVDVIVFNSKILLTGYVRANIYKHTIVSIINENMPNYTVYNEIAIFDEEYKVNSFNDSIVSTNVIARLIGTPNIKSKNFKYNIVDGIVFVIGKVDTKDDLDTVIDTLKITQGVKKVVSYIDIIN